MNKIQILVRLSAAFMEEPIMMKTPDDDTFYHQETNSLPLSDKLKILINEWDSRWQDNIEKYPPERNFESLSDEIEHIQKGFELARLLQRELGDDYIVEYLPNSIQ